MTSALDMSLDDLIKSNKKSGGGGTGGNPSGRGRGSSGPGPGPTRRLPNRAGARPGPYSVGKAPAPDSAWQHDLYSEMAALAPAGRAASIETGTKLYISNLDYGVSNEDIKELFSEVGDLKRFSIHYDRSGRSKGTAEVVFSRRGDALSAVKRYNNVQLDGKPMKIEIVGTNIATPGVVPQAQVSNGAFVNPSGIPRSASGRGGFGGLPRGGGRGRGRGRGRSRGRSEPVSVADLDADLEKYHSKAMQIN